jgi:glycerol uptake facilitator-like aquaporin
VDVIGLPRRLLAEFVGTAPSSAPGFIAAQIRGALIGLALVATLYPEAAESADQAVIPHHWNNTAEQRSAP